MVFFVFIYAKFTKKTYSLAMCDRCKASAFWGDLFTKIKETKNDSSFVSL